MLRNQARWLAACVLGPASLLACGGSAPSAASPFATEIGTASGAPLLATIGAAGGSITSADGVLTVSFPAGALAADTDISITPISNQAPGGLGSAYRIGPEGVTLTAPAEIVFAYADTDLVGTAAIALGIGYQDADRYWHHLNDASLDESTHTLHVQTDHFSDWSRLMGFQIQPASGDVHVGQSVALAVVWCEPVGVPSSTGTPLVTLLARCGPGGDLGTASNWAVNGTPGGGGAFGSVAPSGAESATYTAPASVDAPTLVAVSADLDSALGHTSVVSNLRVIGESADYHATFDFMWQFQTMTYAFHGEMDFGLNPGSAPGATLLGTYHNIGGSSELVHYQLDGSTVCTADHVTVPAQGGLRIYSDGSYHFDVEFPGADPIMAMCTSSSGTQIVNMAAAATFAAPGMDDPNCTGSTVPTSSDPTRLEGSVTYDCGVLGTKMGSWVITRN